MTINPTPATRIQEICATTGTGIYTLGGAVQGYRTFSSVYTSGNLAPYCATDGTNREWGVGTMGTNTLARTTILGSTNGGSAVNWTSPFVIFVTPLAELKPFIPLASDPATPFVGQTWFNSTTRTFKGYTYSPISGSWATSGNLPTATREAMAVGVITSSLYFGGRASASVTGAAFMFNGSTWSTTTSTSQGVANAGAAGYPSGAVCVGGSRDASNGTANNISTVQGFNGSTWNTSTAFPASISALAGNGGSLSACLMYGGYLSSSATAYTYSSNGTTWTQGGTMPSAMYFLSGAGANTSSALAFCGWTSQSAYLYNGTSWSTQNSLPTGLYYQASCGASNQAFSMGGYTYPGQSSSCFLFNGASWIGSASMPSAIYDNSGCGNTSGYPNASTTMCSGGQNGVVNWLTNTFVYSGSSTLTQTFNTN
jgi:hypothetical protein